MKMPVLFSVITLVLVNASCQKENTVQNLSTPSNGFTEWLILNGEHYAQNNVYKPTEISTLKFTVRFDSSAIYTTANPENQYDINKLYGFADNNAFHQQFSARFGWRWSDGALRLFAYDYNDGIRESKELGTVAIGDEVKCAIKVLPTAYVFSMNAKVDSMPRLSEGAVAKGYQLYPYFGGDEAAPHEVRIWIKSEP